MMLSYAMKDLDKPLNFHSDMRATAFRTLTGVKIHDVEISPQVIES